MKDNNNDSSWIAARVMVGNGDFRWTIRSGDTYLAMVDGCDTERVKGLAEYIVGLHNAALAAGAGHAA